MIDVAQMAKFNQIDSGNANTIYHVDQLGPEGTLKVGGRYWGKAGALSRSAKTKAANNAARSELLASLADAYGMKGTYTRQKDDGKIQFSLGFLQKLGEKLSMDMKKILMLDEKFEMKDNYVNCGMPLTGRRIKAVTHQLKIDAKIEAEEFANLKKEHPYPNLDLLLGQVDSRMLGGKATTVFLNKLTSLTDGNPDNVDNKTVEAAIEWTFTIQTHKSPLKINGKSISNPFAIEGDPNGKKRADEIVNKIKFHAKNIFEQGKEGF